MKFYDHTDAGIQLAEKLKKRYSRNQNLIVIALPRGGVPVGFQVAQTLGAPLDIVVTRKLRTDLAPEFGFGAISPDNEIIIDSESVKMLELTEEMIRYIIKQEKKELQRRMNKYRGNSDYPDVKGKIVILVDDGVATGMTSIAAIQFLKKLKPQKIVAAFPVCAADAAKEISAIVDEFICLYIPEEFHAVGAWYENFSQISDEEVINLLS